MSTPSLYLFFIKTRRPTKIAMLKPFQNKYPEKFSDDTVKLHSVFAGFNPSFFGEIEQFFCEKRFQRDEEFEISKPEDIFFAIVKNGEIHVSETLSKNKEKIDYNLKKGGSFGAPNIFDPNFSSFSCRIIETTEILTLSFNDFLDLSNKQSVVTNKLSLNLSNIICDRLVNLNNEYIKLYYQKKILTNKG